MKTLNFGSDRPFSDDDDECEPQRRTIHPGPNKDVKDVHVPPNRAPEVDESTGRVILRLDVPTEDKTNKLWRGLVDLTVHWVDRDVLSFLQFRFNLSTEFRNSFRPEKSLLRLSVQRGDEKRPLFIQSTFAADSSFFIRTQYDAKAATWLKTRQRQRNVVHIVQVILERKVPANERWKRRTFIPRHVGPLPMLA